MVAHVDDLARLTGRNFDDMREEGGVGLGGTPLGGRSHKVGGQIQATQDLPSPHGLIAGDAGTPAQ